MTTVIALFLSFVSGAVVGYLVLRHNPKIKASIDAIADKYLG